MRASNKKIHRNKGFLPQPPNGFKEIPGYDKLYYISKNGEIWSRQINRMLKQTLTEHGYFRVALRKNGKSLKKHTHQWVMLTFVGPANGLDVNHKNSDKLDNRLENLEYITRKENIRHATAAGTNKIRGENNFNAKLNKEQVLDILFKDGRTYFEIAQSYRITGTAVALIKRGENWAHLSKGKEHLILKSPGRRDRQK